MEVQVREPTRSRVADGFFFVILGIAGLLFYRAVRPVLTPVVVGVFAAILANRRCESITRILSGRRHLAASLVTVGVLLLVVIPCGSLGWMLSHQLFAAASTFAHRLAENGPGEQMPAWLRELVPADLLARFANGLAARAAQLLTGSVAALSRLSVGLFVFVVSLYYFLLDGKRWLAEITRLLPMDPRYVRAFAVEFEATSRALMFGTVVTALVQGTAAALGYAIFGVPQPVLWGAVTALMALAPVLGTVIVWFPLSIFLIATASPLRGVGLMLWGVFLTSTIDNVTRPLLMKGRMQVHPLVVFLSILGGVAAFGAVGLLMGPLAATFCFAAVRIYDRDFRPRLTSPGRTGKIWCPESRERS